MVVLLVVLTFLLFMATDVLLPRKGTAIEGAVRKSPGPPRAVELGRPLYVAGFQVQPEMHYHLGHAWALLEGPSRARVGIDDFAARLVGEADRIELPHLGDQLVQGQPAWVLHHGNRRAPMLSPVTGKVVAINPRVCEGNITPGSAPYTHGWLLSVRMADSQTVFNNLLRDDLSMKWFEIDSGRLRSRLTRGFALSFRDGGMTIDGVCDLIDEAQWDDLVHEFLLIDSGSSRTRPILN
jgi:glycine cleavage system H lipoate-binding protein